MTCLGGIWVHYSEGPLFRKSAIRTTSDPNPNPIPNPNLWHSEPVP